jgi:hypothetical protein
MPHIIMNEVYDTDNTNANIVGVCYAMLLTEY